jgi:hypothetical protein
LVLAPGWLLLIHLQTARLADDWIADPVQVGVETKDFPAISSASVFGFNVGQSLQPKSSFARFCA